MDLVAYYVKGDIAPDAILRVVPDDKFATVFDSYSEKIIKRDRDTKKESVTTIYHNILILDSSVSQAVLASSWYRIIRPFYAAEGKDPNSIYWKGFNVKDLVTRYTEITDSKAVYHDKGDYGFVEIDDDFPFPHILVGILRFCCPEDSICNFAVPREVRNKKVSWGKYTTSKTTSATQTPETKGKSRSKKGRKTKKLVVDNDGYTSLCFSKIPYCDVTTMIIPGEDEGEMMEVDIAEESGNAQVINVDKTIVKTSGWNGGQGDQ